MANQGGTLRSNSINGVKVYTVSGQHRPATWLPQKRRKASSKDKDYSRSVELIQDLRFETATTKIKATPDGEFLLATGIYPPQVKVYELRELSLKFERTLVSEIINFQVLGDDYSKLAFLCADRSIRLHAKYGSHYSLRIPRVGRDIAYDCWSCDLICAASSPDLYRINLEQGRFLSSLNTQSPALNVVSRSKLHGLVACGGDDGAVECFDMRTRASVGRLNAVEPAGGSDEEVTALEFDGDGGYHMAVGCSAGKILIYDLRSSSPLRVEDHKYGSPILNIKWHKTLNSERAKLITTDKHIVRIWDPDTGDRMTSIQPTGGSINDLCVYGDSGLMLLALDNSQIPSYFIPALGPAPKWCSYLENLTEELEEDAETAIYDHFKFLTKEDLEKLNLTNLIGTNLLRASMHGFFIDHRLYKKAQAMANPFAYDEYIEQRKKEKLEALRQSQITILKKLPKYNRTLAARLLEEEAETEKKDTDGGDTKKKTKKKKGLTNEDLKDERFRPMFNDKDYEVDEFSPEYLALHPVASNAQPSLVEEHFEPAMDDEELSASDSDASDADHENNKEKKSRAPRLYEVKDQRHAEAFWKNKSLAKEDALPLGERAAALSNNERNSRKFNDVKLGPGGSREISFNPRSNARYKEDEGDEDTHHGKRRGVQSLKLKGDRSSGFQGRGGRGGGRGGGGRGRGRGGGRGRGRGRG